jgi:hypothetical protein
MAFTEYPNLSSGIVSDGFPDRPDGWFLKHLDNGKIYHRVAGEWVDWGLGLSFAPPTKSGSVITDNDGVATVTFAIPFYDNNYTIALTCSDEGIPVVAYLSSRNPDGFSIITRNPRNHRTVRDATVSWLATKDFNE